LSYNSAQVLEVDAMTHFERFTLLVRDYDAAIHFFVDVLQFELVEDTPAFTNDGRRKRWVVVRPPGSVDDFESSYRRMSAAGVRFITPPCDEPFGRVAVFEDLEGNRWDLVGPPTHSRK
jgi:catechol 2,3-dioxygenase-like lactoylglutathione lyase family enzyme